MADGSDTRQPASVQIASALGRPAPEPFTADEEAAFQRWLADGDAQVAARQARSSSSSRRAA